MGKFNQILKENRYVQSVQKDIVLSFYIKKNTKKKSAYAFLTKKNVPTFHIFKAIWARYTIKLFCESVSFAM